LFCAILQGGGGGENSPVAGLLTIFHQIPLLSLFRSAVKKMSSFGTVVFNL
jgi:hypothetical protein